MVDDRSRLTHDKYNKLVYFAPPAIARHERAGHSWNVGILEHWNIGFWASGSESLRLREKMES